MSLRAAGRLAALRPRSPAAAAVATRGLRVGLGYVPQSVRPLPLNRSSGPRELTPLVLALAPRPCLPHYSLAFDRSPGRDALDRSDHAPGQAAALLFHRQAQPLRLVRAAPGIDPRDRAPARRRGPVAADSRHARDEQDWLEVEEPGGDARDRQRQRVRALSVPRSCSPVPGRATL
jgi:hypothetical protein